MSIINQVVQGGGTTPTGTKNITANGVYDVTDFASADVNVPTTAPASYRVFEKDASGKLVNSTSTPWVQLPTGTTDVGNYCLYGAYKGTSANVLSGTLDLSSLTDVSGSFAMAECFSNCTGIISVDLSSLTDVSGNSSLSKCFSNCTGIISVDLSSLTDVSGGSAMTECFSKCTGITSVDLRNLETVTGSYALWYAFTDCSGITNANLQSLRYVSSSVNVEGMFRSCINLTSVNVDSFVRNPPMMFPNCPITTFPYENVEYIFSNAGWLCYQMRFASANMKKLEVIASDVNNMFYGNTYLESLKFPILTRFNGASNAKNFLYGCTNPNFTDLYFPMLCVFRNTVPFTNNSFPSQLTVHFRKDQQTLIQGTSGYPFGASACVFDLVGTITVNGVDYIREGKCNETGYYAWHKNTSSITVNGVVYTYNQQEISRNSYGSGESTQGPLLYGWVNGSTTYYTDTLTPQVGDFIYAAYNSTKSTTLSISAVDNDFVYTVDTAEPEVGDNVYSDTGITLVGTISSIA